MPIRPEDAAHRIGDRVISTYPDNRGQVGTITGVNAPRTVIFVRFPHRQPKGCYPQSLEWEAQEPLFGAPDPEPAPEPTTAGQRRRARQQAQIDHGLHPLTGLPLLGDQDGDPIGETCGSCAHRIRISYHNKTYPKCDRARLAHSEANDCRAWWPACQLWEARP